MDFLALDSLLWFSNTSQWEAPWALHQNRGFTDAFALLHWNRDSCLEFDVILPLSAPVLIYALQMCQERAQDVERGALPELQ